MSDETPTTPAPAPAPAPAPEAPRVYVAAPEPVRPAEPAPAKAEDLATLRTQLEASTRRIGELTERLDLQRAGLLDTEAHDIARTVWQRLPEKDRPSLAEWVATDAARSHRALSAYFPQADTPAPAEVAPPASPAPVIPTSVPGTQPAGAPPTTLDADAALKQRTAELESALRVYGVGHPEVQRMRAELSKMVAERSLVATARIVQ